MEYRMLPRAQCCCGLACACGVCVLGLRRSVLRNREIWGASFVFWPWSADCVDVCSAEADSPWCVLAVVCPTGDSVQRICVTGFCRVLRYRLWEVRPVTTSSGVFVCDRENCIGHTKAGCQRWVGNCVERRGEFLHQWWQRWQLFAVPVMVEGNGPLTVCLVNLGEELISLKGKQNLATAVEIDALVDTEDVEETREKDIGGCEFRSIQAAGDSVVVQEKPEQSQSESQGQKEEQELPEHVCCLYEECRKRLTAEQAKFVREQLIEFGDAFAIHDLDIGWFTIFAHRIRTGKAMPLLKSMRRTPLGFNQEERKTLKAMLDAKVIEPSQSEWASPPVHWL